MKPAHITLRLAAAFCLLGGVLFVVGWQGVSRLRQLNTQAQNIVYQQWKEERLANEALHLSDTNSQITLLVFLLDDPDEIQRLLVQRKVNTQRISELVGAIEPLLEPGKETALFAAVKATRTPYLESYGRALSLLLTEHQPDAARQVMVQVVRPNLLAYHDAWNAFDQHQVGQIDAIEWQSQIDFAADQRDFLLILALAGLITGAIAIFTVARMGREIAVRQRAERNQQQAHDQLEQRILERTADLKQANEALRVENAERRQAETGLSHERDLLRALLDNSPDHIYFKDAQSRFIKSSTAQAVQLGAASPEAMEGKTDFDFFTEEHARIAFEDEQEIMRSGQPMIGKVEKEVLRDGRVSWALTNKMPLRGQDGKIIGTFGVSKNITAIKHAEEALERKKTELQALFDLMPAMIWFKDTENNHLRVNKRAAEVAGKRVEEIEGKPCRDIYPQEAARFYADDLEVIRSQAPKLGIVETIRDRNGKEVWVKTDKVPVCDKDGKVVGIVVMSQDITERKRVEAQLFQSQKMETVGKLAGGIAHEFNSILTAIIGQSELLLGDLPPGSPLGKNAREIRQAAERAAGLTRQLLAYGRKQIFQPKALDLNLMLAEMEGTLRHLMGRDANVLIVPAPGLNAIKMDPGQMEQVIVNLVVNAAEAMPNGGKLTLETANVSFDQERVGGYPELPPGGYVMLAISDTGAGMGAEVKARAFEPFFTTKAVGEGVGLGLSTCYGIVKQSGGHLSVYSEPGRGTTFKIYLPQAEPDTQVPFPRLDSPDLPRGTETILLVEDDPALREMAATLLRRLGYTVLAAANGLEALTLKQQRGTGHVDLLFTDVVMPHMSGRELADRVRALYPQTRILFTSAYTENAIVHQGVLDQGVALLQKPFTPGALARKLREVLDEPVGAGTVADQPPP